MEGHPAQVGINKGDGQHFTIIATSGTESIIDVPFTENNGVYIFKISNEDIEVDEGKRITLRN